MAKEQLSFEELSVACERQPAERGTQLTELASNLALHVPTEVLPAVTEALSAAYSHGFDAGFRLQRAARGKASGQ